MPISMVYLEDEANTMAMVLAISTYTMRMPPMSRYLRGILRMFLGVRTISRPKADRV